MRAKVKSGIWRHKHTELPGLVRLHPLFACSAQPRLVSTKKLDMTLPATFEVDLYSMAAVPIELFFEEARLASASGFIWRSGGEFFPITNWHNVSGRNVFTGKHILE
jgi:hypothetical protein